MSYWATWVNDWPHWTMGWSLFTSGFCVSWRLTQARRPVPSVTPEPWLDTSEHLSEHLKACPCKICSDEQRSEQIRVGGYVTVQTAGTLSTSAALRVQAEYQTVNEARSAGGMYLLNAAAPARVLASEIDGMEQWSN